MGVWKIHRKMVACHECERSCTGNGMDRLIRIEGKIKRKRGVMGENRNRRNKRRSRNSLGNRMALIGITVVVGSLAVVVHIGGTSLRERDLEYQAREQALEKTLAKEEARAAELEEYRVYVQTKQYIEKVAKEKLGLVNKDEILFKADESN